MKAGGFLNIVDIELSVGTTLYLILLKRDQDPALMDLESEEENDSMCLS